jgi:hypothetical protein
MKFGKVCGVLFVLSLVATGAAMGRDISHGTASAKAMALSSAKSASPAKAASAKANKSTAKSVPAPVAVRHIVKPAAPIVMGRSVSVHHNTKLHHVKIKPLDASDTPVVAAGAVGSY